MELILLTTPEFFVEEDKILTSLFEEGLDVLHLRKPGTEPIYAERLLTLLPQEYCKKIVVHDHFYLKEEFGLKGIHLNHRNPEIPAGYKGHVSRSCHSFDEVKQYKKNCNYVFLSPIYDSITKKGMQGMFTYDQLKQASKDKIIDKNVMALGGVTLEKIPELKSLGFGGVVVMGELWSKFNIHSTSDYKDLITFFRQLRKAVN